MNNRRKTIERISKANPYIWIGLIIAAALLSRMYHLTYPLDDAHAFRQAQTAGLIRDYYREGINLLYPRMITLGNPGYVVLEFPLYQALAALLYKILSPNIIWSRLLSVLSGLLSILLIYRTTAKFMDQKSAIFASLFFACAPFNIFHNRTPIPESLTILLSLIMLDFLIEGINNKRNVFLVLGIISGCFGLMMKSPYVAPLYIPLVCTLIKREQGLKSLLNIRFLAVVTIPAAAMILWQRHANAVNELYFSTVDYPFKELYASVVVKLRPLNLWYFGNIDQRLTLENYSIIGGRIFRHILSGAGIFFLGIGFVAVIKKKAGIFSYSWLFSVIGSILVIFNLNIVHDYYQMPIAPILAVFCGAGFSYLTDLFRNRTITFVAAAALMSFYIFTSWSFTTEFFNRTNDLVEVGRFIDNSVEKNAMIATSTAGPGLWDPTLMYYADRRGFDVRHRRLNEKMIGYLRGRDVKYLAIVDYKGNFEPLDSAISTYRPVAKNDRVTIYDISGKHI